MLELLPPDFRDDVFFRVPATFLAAPFLDPPDLVVVRPRLLAPDRLATALRVVKRVALDFPVVALRPAAFFAAGFFLPELDDVLVALAAFPREIAAGDFPPALSPVARLAAEAVFPPGEPPPGRLVAPAGRLVAPPGRLTPSLPAARLEVFAGVLAS